MSKFRKVLKNRNFFFLWLGQIISQLGDRLGQMALIAFVYLRSPGSTMDMAKILSFTIIPVFLIGPVAGVYVDRWDRRRTMYICDLLRAVLIFTIPFFLFYYKSIVPIYIIIFLVFSIGRFFVPAKLSIVPDLVDKKDLLIANSLVNITGMLAAVLGFGISGVLVEWVGPKSGFYLNALSFLTSGLLIFFIAKRFGSQNIDFMELSREIVETIRKSVLQEIKEGVLYFIRKKDIRLTASIMFILWSALGAVYVVMIVFVQDVLKSATKDLGLLVMFLGIGLFTGSILYGRFGQRLSHYKIIFSSLALSGVMLIIFTLTINRYPCFFTAASLAFILGNTISPIMIASNTIIHKASDNEMMGKVFSSLEIVMHLGFLLFMFISSLLAERFSHTSILITVGCIFSFVGIANIIVKRKIPWLD
ncbi:MAG: MFS transporter [Candidatus Omnitrophica bacterium]|jgi:predicted MFS family arabinose efflux permease|nr:MFS transporter [Candidatus Omnitrophota bacterium]MDD4981793.1 MFS transporter [Candidatus Omnitrophota bacterium]MDD5665279.1 MFS transporter [Candidatus Omnitrophota bacterium]